MSRIRQNINIELGEGSKDALEAIRKGNGMTQKELVGRLIGWFCDQDRVIQQVILGQIPEEIAPDVARIVLEKLIIAKGEAPGFGGRLAGNGRSDRSTNGSEKVSSLVGEIPDDE